MILSYHWWYTIAHLIILCNNADEDTKPTVQTTKTPKPNTVRRPDIIVDTTTGIAEHTLISPSDKPQIHYLVEWHETTLHVIFRLPNINEIKVGATHANIKCSHLDDRIAELESKYNSALEYLFGPNHHNVGEHADNKNPVDARVPDLLLNIKRPTQKYGLPVIPRENRAAISYHVAPQPTIVQEYDDYSTYNEATTTAPRSAGPTTEKTIKPATTPTSTTSTTTSTSTTPTTSTTTTTSTTATTSTTTTKPSTTSLSKTTTLTTKTTSTTTLAAKPLSTTMSTPTTPATTENKPEVPKADDVTDPDNSGQISNHLNVNGKILILHSLTFNPTWVRQETTSLYTEAISSPIYEATANAQKTEKSSESQVTVQINQKSLKSLTYCVRPINEIGTVNALLGVANNKINVFNTREYLRITAANIPRTAGPIRLQIRITYFEKTKADNWQKGSDTFNTEHADCTIEYTQSTSRGTLRTNKVCHRAITTDRYFYAYCIILTNGVFLFKSDTVNINAQLSKAHNLALLVEIALEWTKPSSPSQSLHLTADGTGRRRRQALIAGGFAGAAAVIGVEEWLNSHSSSSRSYKDLSKHMADLATNVEKAIEDEQEKIIHLDKHLVSIDQNEASLLCTQTELTISEISTYIYEKMQLTLTEVQILGREVEAAPEKSRLNKQFDSLCKLYNEYDKNICMFRISTAKMLDIEHQGTALSAKVVFKSPVSELEKRENCKVTEEIALPKLTRDKINDFTKVETLSLPHRIHVNCNNDHYYYTSTDSKLLSSRSLLVKLSAASAALECNPRRMQCPKEQYSTSDTCLRTLYTTLNNKEFVAISSTTTIEDNEFSTLKAHGIHGQSHYQNTTISHKVKVYNRKSKTNVQIRCGQPVKTYNIHSARSAEKYVIAHVSNTTGNLQGMKSLQDIFQEELTNIQKQQKLDKIRANNDYFETTLSIKKLNETKNDILNWSKSLGLWPISDAHWWALLGVIIALLITICIAIKVRHRCHRPPPPPRRIFRTNNRLSRIYRTSQQ